MRKGISITVTPADRVRLQSIIGDRNSPEIIIVGCILARLMPSGAVHTNRSKSLRVHAVGARSECHPSGLSSPLCRLIGYRTARTPAGRANPAQSSRRRSARRQIALDGRAPSVEEQIKHDAPRSLASIRNCRDDGRSSRTNSPRRCRTGSGSSGARRVTGVWWLP
jgi:hypothetical protein